MTAPPPPGSGSRLLRGKRLLCLAELPTGCMSNVLLAHLHLPSTSSIERRCLRSLKARLYFTSEPGSEKIPQAPIQVFVSSAWKHRQK